MAWKRQAAIAGIAAGLAGGLAVQAAAPRHEMRFWFENEAAARRAGARHFEDHPCGGLAVVRVERMPPYVRHAALEPELVVEYGENRRELRRWSGPVDGAVWGVRGDEILINLVGRFYWIGTDGRIRRARPGAPLRATAEGQCGTPAGMENSAYSVCLAFRDQTDGRVRHIWSQNVCT